MKNLFSQLHNLRRVVALGLALLLCMSAVQVAAAAESGSCGEDLTWSLSGGHLTIQGRGPMTDFTDENMPPWYASAPTITKVTVGEGVTAIGSLAFFGCGKAATVALPATIESIGDRAFKECGALGTLNLPASLHTIGEAAFESCLKLNGIRLPEGLKTIGDYAFYRCEDLGSITVPAGVQSFGMVVFAYCKGLTQATILCPVEKLPDWTFYGCKNLTSVVLPETVEAAGEYTFHDCAQLNTIHYSGTASDELMEDIRKDENSISPGAVITPEAPSGTGIKGESSFDESGTVGTGTITTTTETDNSHITEEVTTESTYKVNGKDATLEDIAAAGPSAEIEAESNKKVEISATVENSEGWAELGEQVSETLGRHEDDTKVEVNVTVKDTTVEGDDLANLAGKDVPLKITTGLGDTWTMQMDQVKKSEVAGKKYDLTLTVTPVEGDKVKIDCEQLFKIEFASNIDFPVTVDAHVGYARQNATLYKKSGSQFDAIHSVVIDGNGVAWFSLPKVEKRGVYYAAINAAGVDAADVTVPETLYNEYNVTDTGATLTDAQGNYYEVGERESAWGITSGQFALYVGIGIGAVVLLVTLIMVTWNKIQKSKEKYRIVPPEEYEDDYDDDDDGEPIDEEALRLEIMRELLGEATAK